MIEYGLTQPFKWYLSISDQNRFKRWCNEDYCSYKLISPNDRLLPFQIVRSSIPNIITAWNIYSLDDTSCIMSLFDFMRSGYDYEDYGLTIKTCGDLDYITYTGEIPFWLFENFGCGFYYSSLSDGINTWYSEVFWMDDLGDIETEIIVSETESLAYGDGVDDIIDYI